MKGGIMESPEPQSKQAEWEKSRDIVVAHITERLQCYTPPLQRAVVEALQNALPELEAEYNAEMAHQQADMAHLQAVDDYLALTADKSADEIRAMTAKVVS